MLDSEIKLKAQIINDKAVVIIIRQETHNNTRN